MLVLFYPSCATVHNNNKKGLKSLILVLFYPSCATMHNNNTNGLKRLVLVLFYPSFTTMRNKTKKIINSNRDSLTNVLDYYSLI